MKLELVARKDVSRVLLEKDEKYCLGITFTDGTKDKAGPVVKKVKLKGPAGKSFAVSEGDVILSLNGYSTVGTKSKDIIRMIKEAGNAVDIKLQYEMRELRISQSGVYRRLQLKTELQKVKHSFGFVLRKKDSEHSFALEYPVISNIKGESQLHKNGQIQEGDRLLKVDDLSLSWLSLADIACILREKDEAEFTFEYDIRVVNFSETGMKVDLDMDVPFSDLGMDLCADSEKCDFMYIDNIRSGSIAERSGVFCEGDIFLSINEIEAKFLTALKANMLLQNNRKCRKISFIPSKRNEVKTLNVEVLNENCGSRRDTATTSSNSDQTCHDWKHVNTPVSSNIAFPEALNNQKSCFKTFGHSDQIKAINNLQNIVQVMKSLKENLSQLTCAAFDKKPHNINEICTLCNECQHSVKLCPSCLTKMDGTFLQSMDVLQNFITHFVTLSSVNPRFLGKDETNTEENGINLKVPAVNLIYELAETLPKLIPEEPQLREKFEVLANEIITADTSCNICDYGVKSVWTNVQKLLLLLSLEDNRQETKTLIYQLVCCLLDEKFYCDSESAYQSSSLYDCNSIRTENLSVACLQPFSDSGSSFESNTNTTQINIESESNGIRNSKESSLNIPQVNISMHKDYLKLTHIQGSVEFCNENQLCEGNVDSESPVENDSAPLVQDISFSSLNSKGTCSNSNKKVYKDKGLKLTPAKVWRSLESILRPNKSPRQQPDTKYKLSPNPNKCTATNSNGMSRDAPSTSFNCPVNNLSPNHEPVANGENTSGSKSESTPSSSTNPPQKGGRINFKKTRTDTVQVKMTNKRGGFGLDLGVKSNSANSSVVPVIYAIKQKSPAQKSGILNIDDRIIAINRQSTLGLTPKELQTMKKTAFSADTITLIIEFDVVEAELKFGTFDVVLDKTLKIGLIFEDMQRGFPIVVSGIVKGSAAHRCGQLFPEDKIKFLRCVRNEEFDPVSGNYIKEESVLITVQRDQNKGLQKKSSNSSPCYFNPCFSHRDSVPRKGMGYIVQSTAMHSVEGTDALVLDQEVTLFRDPVSWDFGFLVGENPDTGRAYITDVRPDGPAYESRVIKKFDRIIEVNGISVDKNLENSVLSLLSRANHKVDLLIRRLYHEDSNSV